MARKPTSSKKPVAEIVAKPAATPAVVAMAPETSPAATTPVRKTVVPKASPSGAAIGVTQAKAPVPLTYERIAERAYYISQSGGGSEYDNWLRAEAELKGEVA